MRILPLFAPVLLSSSLFAQAPSRDLGPISPTNPVFLPAGSFGNCPVSLEARHANQGALMAVGRGSDEARQGYSLTFSPSDARPVAQARIILHGWSGTHLQPAADKTSSEANVGSTEIFTLSPLLTSNNRFLSTVYIHKLTGVQWIELNEVTYTDGTHWHESDAGACGIVPNGFLLVAAGK